VASHWLNAALKGLVEGVTEFLPVSSTGHLILVNELLPLTDNPARAATLDNLFNIVVQFPAILAVMILYRKRLTDSALGLSSRPESRRFWLAVFLAFLPLALAGLAFKNVIEEKLMNPTVVAAALIVGGVVLLFVERFFSRAETTRAENISIKNALIIGLFQCLALVPGTSRSASTIIGGRLMGLSRQAAAEFSFFLAIPVLGAAFVYKLAKEYHAIQWSTDGPILAIGSVTAFASAWLVVALFIRFLEKNSMAVFGWYRIALGILVLVLAR
jgi:undecaprenyl-diphosphatase